MKGRKSNHYNFSFIKILPLLVIFVILSISIGFSFFSSTLSVNGAKVEVRVVKDIRITNVSVDSTNNAIIKYNDYDVSTVLSRIVLSSSESIATFNVRVTNIGNVIESIYDIYGLPENLEIKSISGYNLKDKICDSNNNCKLGASKDVLITIGYKENGYDSSNTEYEIGLNFDFRAVYDIVYERIINHNYPDKIYENETLNITFVDDIPTDIMVVNATFNYDSPSLSIFNPSF